MIKKTSPSRPYQQFLLRVFHGLTGMLTIAAMLTAYWTYDTYDGRWGRIPLLVYNDTNNLAYNQVQ